MTPIGLVILISAELISSAGASRRASRVPSFDAFIQKYGRSYKQDSEEYRKRSEYYEQVKAAADLQNHRSDRLWTAGVNHLWDWSGAELQKLRGWDGSRKPGESGGARSIQPHGTFLQQQSPLPAEKYWSDLASSMHIQNQGGCGSCWAIAASTVLEAHAEIYTGTKRTFSAQQIVECTPNPRHCGGDGGCKGATAELAMDWVLHNGCADETQVPYTGLDGACPKVSPALKMAQVFSDASSTSENDVSDVVPNLAASFGMVGWETLPKNKYEPLVRALAEKGPVAISVAASSWQMYESGIFNGCGKDAIIDHAVVAFGYGEENGVKYWLIQNSWGEDWGELGHIRLQRHDKDEYCGMNSKPELGVACKGETTPVPVCGMCGILFDSVVPHFQSKQDASKL